MCHGCNPKASLTWGSDYIRTHIVPDNEKNQALAAIHSQTLPAKNTLKYDYKIYLHSQLILYFTFVNTLCIFSKKLTQSQYRHQQVVRTFGDLIVYYNERGLTHISHILSYAMIIKGIGYDVNRYITTVLWPCKEFSEKRPWTNEEEWWALTSGQ